MFASSVLLEGNSDRFTRDGEFFKRRNWNLSWRRRVVFPALIYSRFPGRMETSEWIRTKCRARSRCCGTKNFPAELLAPFPFSCQFPILRRTNSPPYGVPCIKCDFNRGFTVLRHFPVGHSNFCSSVNLGGKVYDKSSWRKVSAAWSVTRRWIHLFACLCRSYVSLEIASSV